MLTIWPIDFRSNFQGTDWLDWKLVDNLLRTLDCLWPESQLPPRNTTDPKEIDKRISDMLDVVYSEDHAKLLQVKD